MVWDKIKKLSDQKKQIVGQKNCVGQKRKNLFGQKKERQKLSDKKKGKNCVGQKR